MKKVIITGRVFIFLPPGAKAPSLSADERPRFLAKPALVDLGLLVLPQEWKGRRCSLFHMSGGSRHQHLCFFFSTQSATAQPMPFFLICEFA
ncbi:hypothetical protein GLW04_03465 [Halobacillus litoralis]|uniref:Uncharacterized protein n=1 Tax=Halobacillus litoralis TaxID=45668 RepID=A0A845DNI9_9BACI|nr:hypothetical protein [Halobacillus litoralis]MYL18933.1 hypothetical protein [Halobacillus litoralis]